ncbi:hypothetical protein HDE_10167 [Halotydeus destructor]|nr:hypothetical protein HDE_10167 [Halotydeus destructor]
MLISLGILCDIYKLNKLKGELDSFAFNRTVNKQDAQPRTSYSEKFIKAPNGLIFKLTNVTFPDGWIVRTVPLDEKEIPEGVEIEPWPSQIQPPILLDIVPLEHSEAEERRVGGEVEMDNSIMEKRHSLVANERPISPQISD